MPSDAGQGQLTGPGFDPTIVSRNSRFDLFLSYVSEDSEEARALYRALSSLGLHVYLDLDKSIGRAGGDGYGDMAINIERCACLIVLVTPAWLARGTIVNRSNDEVQFARGKIQPLILLSGFDPDEKISLPLPLSGIIRRGLRPESAERIKAANLIPGGARFAKDGSHRWREEADWEALLIEVGEIAERTWVRDLNYALLDFAENPVVGSEQWYQLNDAIVEARKTSRYHRPLNDYISSMTEIARADFERQFEAFNAKVREFLLNKEAHIEGERQRLGQQKDAYLVQIGAVDRTMLSMLKPVFDSSDIVKDQMRERERADLLQRINSAQRDRNAIAEQLEAEKEAHDRTSQRAARFREERNEQHELNRQVQLERDQLVTALASAQADAEMQRRQVEELDLRIATLFKERYRTVPAPRYRFSRDLDIALNRARDAYSRAELQRGGALREAEVALGLAASITHHYDNGTVPEQGLSEEIDDGPDEIHDDATVRATGVSATRPGRVLYRGTYHDGRRDGHAVIEWRHHGLRYAGEVRDGVPHGLGVMEQQDGNTYLGEWIDNQKTGAGYLMQLSGWMKLDAEGSLELTVVEANAREFVAGLFTEGVPIIGALQDRYGGFYEGEMRGYFGSIQRHGFGVLWDDERLKPQRLAADQIAAGRWAADVLRLPEVEDDGPPHPYRGTADQGEEAVERGVS